MVLRENPSWQNQWSSREESPFAENQKQQERRKRLGQLERLDQQRLREVLFIAEFFKPMVPPLEINRLRAAEISSISRGKVSPS